MKSVSLWTVAAAICVGVLSPTLAQATTIPLSNPAVTGPVSGPAVLAGPMPVQWVGGLGNWWAPEADQSFNNPYVAGTGSLPGDYVYTLTFDLTGYDPLSAVLAGKWRTDNAGEVKLNGVSGGLAGPTSYNAVVPPSFSFGPGSGAFLPNLNMLQFFVNNEDATGQPWAGPLGQNPTGVYIEITQSEATAVPEPMTLGLFGMGLVGMCARRLRNRR